MQEWGIKIVLEHKRTPGVKIQRILAVPVSISVSISDNRDLGNSDSDLTMDSIEEGRPTLQPTTSTGHEEQASISVSEGESPEDVRMASNDDAELNEIEQKTGTEIKRKPPQDPEQVPEVASLASGGGEKETKKEEGAIISPELLKAAIEAAPSTFEPKRHEKVPTRALQPRGRARRASKALGRYEKKTRLSKHAQELLEDDGAPPDSINIQDNRSQEESSISSGTKSHKSDPKRSIYLTEEFNFTPPSVGEQGKADFLFDDNVYQEKNIMREVSLEDIGDDSFSDVQYDKYGIPVPPRDVDMMAADKYMFDKEAHPKSYSMAMNEYVGKHGNGNEDSCTSFEAFEDEPPPVDLPKKPSLKVVIKDNAKDDDGGILDRVSSHLRSSMLSARSSVFGIEEEGSGQGESSHNSHSDVDNETGLFLRRSSENNSIEHHEDLGPQFRQSYFSAEVKAMYDGQSIPTEDVETMEVGNGIFRVYSRKEWISRRFLKSACIAVFLAIAIVSLSMVFVNNNNSSGTGSASDMANLSRSKPGRPAPSAPDPFSVVAGRDPNAESYSSNRVTSLIEEAMQGTIDDPKSPQGQALEWILQDAVGNPPEKDFRVLQRFGLATFHFATVSDSEKWDHVTGWLSVEHECTWHNVRCGPDGSLSFPETGAFGRKLQNPLSDHVTYLAMDENNLHGTIPDEISLLSNLAQLHLQGNFLDGTIPEALSKLERLHTVYLDNNYFTGTLTDKIGNLPLLMNVDISKNSMTGSIPDVFSTFAHLSYLRLDDNNFSGNFPSSLVRLSSLQVLTLGNNDLKGELPQDVSQIGKLGILQLHENEFFGNIPDFSSPFLEEIHLDNNAFTGSIPSISGSTNLREVRMERNLLSGKIPVELADNTNLQRLWLDHNQLSGVVPHELGRLEELVSLKVHGNSLIGVVPTSVCKLRDGSLETLQATCVGNSDLTCSCCTNC